jgi:uroporphyrinogen decarboxylase
MAKDRAAADKNPRPGRSRLQAWLAEVKRRYGDRVGLIGNGNCGLLDTGSDQEVVESARYALRHGMPAGGYVFSTSHCLYIGMPLARYELMWNL